MNKCECCKTNEAMKIALEREGEEGYWFCNNCMEFVHDFLDAQTATKWSEVFYNTINAQSCVGAEDDEA